MIRFAQNEEIISIDNCAADNKLNVLVYVIVDISMREIGYCSFCCCCCQTSYQTLLLGFYHHRHDLHNFWLWKSCVRKEKMRIEKWVLCQLAVNWLNWFFICWVIFSHVAQRKSHWFSILIDLTQLHLFSWHINCAAPLSPINLLSRMYVWAGKHIETICERRRAIIEKSEIYDYWFLIPYELTVQSGQTNRQTNKPIEKQIACVCLVWWFVEN